MKNLLHESLAPKSNSFCFKKIALLSVVSSTFSTAVLSNTNECASIIKAAQDAYVEYMEQSSPKQYSNSNRNETVKSWIGWLKIRSEEAVDPKQMQFFRDYQKDRERNPISINIHGAVFKLNNLGWDAVECSAKLIRAGIKPNYQAIPSGGDSRITSSTTNQQNQSTQQQAQQTQQLAAQNQTRADQARQGQRRRHEPENEASHCIQPDFGGLYGGMKNTCDFKVWYTYCGYRPKENSWLTGMSCEKQSFGSDSVSPGRTSASHTKGVESIHWIACKEPAWTVDTEFVPGQGIKGRCHTVGGK